MNFYFLGYLYIKTNQQTTINDAAKHKSEVKSFPQVFEEFEGYKEVKRKQNEGNAYDII